MPLPPDFNMIAMDPPKEPMFFPIFWGIYPLAGWVGYLSTG